MLRVAPHIIAVGLAAGSSAQAQTLAAATLEGTYEQSVDNESWQTIHVSAGVTGTALQFDTTTNNERVVITYNGSCLALGFIVLVRAKVDSIAANPGAEKGVPLCYLSVGGSTYPASRTFTAIVPNTGVHQVTLEVQAARGSGGAAILIGESALTVQH